ncbi:MAG: homocysteine S-methyltransferase family protein [Planctomycetes bacterium]|nr:homocysteine S-methyltransferase family protein [Planctomycetota bacterium]
MADSPLPETDDRAPIVNPALYRAGKQLFLKAGSRILRARSAEGIKLCKAIVPPTGFVCGVVGPSAKILGMQEITAEELLDECRQKILGMIEAKPDAILIQSITDVEEAVLCLKAARETCKLKVGVSMTYGSGVEQAETVMGQGCEEVTRRLADEGADLVGCDCGMAVDESVLIVRLMRQATQLPIAVFPDAGQRELHDDKIVYVETPQDFASKAPSLVAAGANIIGGCCGVSPDHIACLADVVGERGAP